MQRKLSVAVLSAKNPHRRIDRIIEEQDRLIASRLRRDRRVLRLAQRNLRRWMAREKRPRACYLEWNAILTRLGPVEIADFLESGSPMARRLSQSSPFAGVLSGGERLALLRSNEKTRA
jgi:hypothetical protein